MEASPGLDRGLQEAVLKETLPVMSPPTTGSVRVDRRDEVGRLRPLDGGAGLISDATIAARGFTNEYLAGQGVGDDDGGGQGVQGI